MNLDASLFSIHDVSAFPFVVFNQAAAQPGYAAQWGREMSRLLQFGKPFVVVYDQPGAEESHEDRKHRGLWLKKNKIQLGEICKGLVNVEPDEERRVQIKAMSDMAMKAFGIRQEVVASVEEAFAIAHVLTASR